MKLQHETITIEKIYTGGIVLAFILLSFYLYKSSSLQLKNIDCSSQYGPCNVEDLAKFEQYKNKNLLFLDSSEVKNKGEESYNNRKVIVQKYFPGTLKIILEKRKSIVALKSRDPRSPILAIDRDGTLIDTPKETQLPVIYIRRNLGDLYLGEKVEQPVVNAVQVFYLSQKYWNIQDAVLDQDKLQITLDSQTIVNFALDRDPQALVGALQLIETRSRIEGKLPKLIDLRYIRPVLTY